MNLETLLPNSLWEAVKVNFEKNEFTPAILDCCYFVSELLREKSGADGDGIPLVGQALGGASPKIRIAKDQSETEQNIQKGIESILRGFYQAIRNPRSHNKVQDNSIDTISIILFCGFLVRKIEQGRAIASKEELIKRALDQDFVPSDKYANLLISEIPPRLRLEVFFGVYEHKTSWRARKIRFFNKNIIEQMSVEQRGSVIETISDELKVTDDNAVIRSILSGMPPETWISLADIAKLRIENKIINSIYDGRYDRATGRCLSGALATWCIDTFPYFLSRKELISAVAAKLRSFNTQESDYALQYLVNDIFVEFNESELTAINSVYERRLKEGDGKFHESVLELSWILQANLSEAVKSAFSSFMLKEESDDNKEPPF